MVASCLQLVQNSAARIITLTPSIHHITPVLQQLHWLPVQFRLKFKVLLLTFKATHNLAPPHICPTSSTYPLPPAPSESLPPYTCLYPLLVSSPWGTELSAALLSVFAMLYHPNSETSLHFHFSNHISKPICSKLPIPPDANNYVCVVTFSFFLYTYIYFFLSCVPLK